MQEATSGPFRRQDVLGPASRTDVYSVMERADKRVVAFAPNIDELLGGGVDPGTVIRALEDSFEN